MEGFIEGFIGGIGLAIQGIKGIFDAIIIPIISKIPIHIIILIILGIVLAFIFIPKIRHKQK